MDVEPQIRLARGLVGAVAHEAVVRQDRTDLALEIHDVRGNRPRRRLPGRWSRFPRNHDPDRQNAERNADDRTNPSKVTSLHESSSEGIVRESEEWSTKKRRLDSETGEPKPARPLRCYFPVFPCSLLH